MSRDTLHYDHDEVAITDTAGRTVVPFIYATDPGPSCRTTLTDIGNLTREQLGHLLAAAPELLIAARASLALASGLDECFQTGSGVGARERAILERAIAKAEGKEVQA